MMGGWGYGGNGIFHSAFWVVILLAVIVGVVWLVRTSAGGQVAVARRSSGLAVLEEHYARGDINRDEYLQKIKRYHRLGRVDKFDPITS